MSAEAALSGGDYTLAPVRTPAALDAAYDVLHTWFGVRGEIERREVFEDWLSTPDGRWVEGLHVRHHMTVARGRDGAIAAVRDTHVIYDPEGRRCVVYLSHAYVEPPHRRTGLARRLRELPLAHARADLEDWRANDASVLLGVEQEPIATGLEETVVRLVAYGRSGFRAIDPRALPYCQADFSDVAASGVPARPLPLLAVVRHVGHEGEADLPAPLAEAFVRHIYAVAGTHCRAADLEAPRRHALDALAEFTALAERAAPTVPLLPLPSAMDDQAAIAAVHENACRPHFPAAWWRGA